MLRVQVIRAWPHRHEALELSLPAGGGVADALAAAGWVLDAGHPGVALNGRRVQPDQPLQGGDRVDALRALELDPRQARALRAQRARERRARGTGA